ncbi:hypothetical protein VUR80DRAFT_3434 [Thermomyces stellatus]
MPTLAFTLKLRKSGSGGHGMQSLTGDWQSGCSRLAGPPMGLTCTAGRVSKLPALNDTQRWRGLNRTFGAD